jgi:hypothetical protein
METLRPVKETCNPDFEEGMESILIELLDALEEEETVNNEVEKLKKKCGPETGLPPNEEEKKQLIDLVRRRIKLNVKHRDLEARMEAFTGAQ